MENNRANKSVKGRIFSFTVIIPAMLFTVFFIYLYLQNYNSVFNEKKALLQVLSLHIRDSASLIVASKFEILRVARTYPEIRETINLLPDEAAEAEKFKSTSRYSALKTFLEEMILNSGIDSISLSSGKSPVMISSSDTYTAPETPSSEKWYTGAVEQFGQSSGSSDMVFISKPYTHRDSQADERYVNFSSIVSDENGTVSGVAMLEYNIREILSFIRTENVSKSIDISFWQADDTLENIWSISDESGSERLNDSESPAVFSEMSSEYRFEGNFQSLNETLLINDTTYFEAETWKGKMMIQTVRIPGTPWMMFIGMPVSAISTGIIRSVLPPVVILGIVFFTMQFLVYFFITYIMVKPLSKVGNNLYTLAHAEADLTLQLEEKSTGEIKTLVQSFNYFMVKLRELVITIYSSVEKTATVKSVLTGSLTEASHSIVQMKNGVFSLGERMKRLDMYISENYEVIERISKEIINMNELIHKQVESASHSSKETTVVIEAIEKLSSRLLSIKETTENLMSVASKGREQLDLTEAAFKDVSEKITEIKNMAIVITGIAQQTNLLSMNASIEAAHAGESGSGFSVVAGEIRILADNASQSASKIQSVVKEIIQSVSGADLRVKATSDSFTEITNEVNETITGFIEIQKSVNELSATSKDTLRRSKIQMELSKSLFSGSADIKNGTDDIVTSSDNIRIISGEVTREMGLSESIIVDVTREMENIENLSAELSSIIEYLKNQSSRFKI